MIKSYLINMDRCEGRLIRFEDIASNLGLNVARISAVDGRTLSPSELEAYANPAPRFGQLGPGEIGCFLSHRKAWEAIRQSGDEWAAVFEDDVYLSPDATRLLSDVSWIPPGADIVKLETTLIPVALGALEGDVGFTEVPRTLLGLLSPHGGAGGYLISRNAAHDLLNDPDAVRDPVDEYLFNPFSPVFSKIRVLQLSPAICIQHVILTDDRSDADLNSTIQHERDGKWKMEWESNRPKGFAKIWREVSRPFRQMAKYLAVRYSIGRSGNMGKIVDYR